MRLALLTVFVLTIVPATSNAQSPLTGVSSDQRFTIKPLALQQNDKTMAATTVHRHTKRGLVIGLAVGAVAGVAYGRSANPGEMGRGYNEAVGAIGFGAIGAVCGALIGYAWRSH